MEIENSKIEHFLDQKIEIGDSSEAEMTLTWEGVGLQIKKRAILENISGYAKSGECLSILGASGSGKTTLLSLISGKLKCKSNFKKTGDIRLNGNKMVFSTYQNIVGFVMQQDVFMETMTIEEIFKFVVCLREPKLNEKEKQKRVDSVIRDLKLESCRNNYVGGQFIKGISGGEKRRLNIGFELLKNPKVLFLDEPTSGLDSYTGFIILRILKNLAKKRNMMIIYTIHQPSVEMCNLFENVMILNKGKTAYFGDSLEIENFYQNHGFPCPQEMNSYDHYLEVSINGGDEVDQSFFKNFEKNQKLSNQIQEVIEKVKKTKINTTIQKANFFSEFFILFKRALTNFVRNPFTLKIRFFQVIFVSILFLLLYWRLEDVNIEKQITIQNRLGAFYFLSINLFMMYFQTAIATFPAERKVFRKEYNSGLYGVTSYLSSKLLIELPLIALLPCLFSIITYKGVNFIDTWEHFLFFALGAVMIVLTSTMLGILYTTFVSDLQTAIQVAPLIFVPFMLFSGFTTNINNLIAFLDFFQYVSPIKYIFEYFVTNEFIDLTSLGNFNPIKVLNFTFGLEKIIFIFLAYIAACLFLAIVSMKFNSKPLSD